MRVARRLIVGVMAATVALGAGIVAQAADGTATVIVPLRPVANAPLSGTATFVDLGNGRSQVIVVVSGAATGEAGPVDLRDGSCPVPGSARLALAPVAGGTSTSEVALSVADLKAGHLAVVVHRVPPPPVTDTTGFLVCGTVAAPEAGAMVMGEGTRTFAIGGTVGTIVLIGVAGLLVVERRRRRRRAGRRLGN